MNRFILTKNNLVYTLTCNSHEISKEQFLSPTKAVEHFRNYVTSFRCATLVVDFPVAKDMSKFWEERC